MSGIIFEQNSCNQKYRFMTKIILRVGALFFFISIIIFSQKNMDVVDILIKSFSLAIVFTILLSGIVLIFARASNKGVYNNKHETNQNENEKLTNG